jgi:hypothetical protein
MAAVHKRSKKSGTRQLGGWWYTSLLCTATLLEAAGLPPSMRLTRQDGYVLVRLVDMLGVHSHMHIDFLAAALFIIRLSPLNGLDKVVLNIKLI